MRGLRTRNAGRVVSVLLTTLALLSSILAASGLPHTHSGPNPGFFNQDHDLSSLAGLTASGPLPAAPAFGPALVVRTLIAPLPPRLVWRPAGGSSSRAPLVSA
jgi:hypothetical protein